MSKTKEQVYREQLQDLGLYHEILEPEIKALARVEREYTRAQKAWSATASPAGSAPSFLDPHYAIVQKLRAEGLQHREALMSMAKTLAKLAGTAGGAGPDQGDLLTQKLDAIAQRVAAYDVFDDITSDQPDSMGADLRRDPFAGIPVAEETAAISDMMDQQEIRVAQDLYEMLPDAKAAAKISHGMDDDLAAAVAEDMG